MATRARVRSAGHYAVKFGVLICILGFLGLLSTFSSSFRPTKFNGARRTILDDDDDCPELFVCLSVPTVNGSPEGHSVWQTQRS
jgi:hypothetical protein